MSKLTLDDELALPHKLPPVAQLEETVASNGAISSKDDAVPNSSTLLVRSVRLAPCPELKSVDTTVNIANLPPTTELQVSLAFLQLTGIEILSGNKNANKIPLPRGTRMAVKVSTHDTTYISCPLSYGKDADIVALWIVNSKKKSHETFHISQLARTNLPIDISLLYNGKSMPFGVATLDLSRLSTALQKEKAIHFQEAIPVQGSIPYKKGGKDPQRKTSIPSDFIPGKNCMLRVQLYAKYVPLSSAKEKLSLLEISRRSPAREHDQLGMDGPLLQLDVVEELPITIGQSDKKKNIEKATKSFLDMPASTDNNALVLPVTTTTLDRLPGKDRIGKPCITTRNEPLYRSLPTPVFESIEVLPTMTSHTNSSNQEKESTLDLLFDTSVSSNMSSQISMTNSSAKLITTHSIVNSCLEARKQPPYKNTIIPPSCEGTEDLRLISKQMDMKNENEITSNPVTVPPASEDNSSKKSAPNSSGCLTKDHIATISEAVDQVAITCEELPGVSHFLSQLNCYESKKGPNVNVEVLEHGSRHSNEEELDSMDQLEERIGLTVFFKVIEDKLFGCHTGTTKHTQLFTQLDAKCCFSASDQISCRLQTPKEVLDEDDNSAGSLIDLASS